ncbi:hypothetical protein NDU88_002329 [Pleurodeles waltl]|uniref:Uncharacterized protein n=1 Tax=Pleurodeles waltl TaxID=8319 RepID=A0AAV7UV95_PLEWA|nr:hypothetical protein NDU88_002329 [Pleurodeles waltl]
MAKVPGSLLGSTKLGLAMVEGCGVARGGQEAEAEAKPRAATVEQEQKPEARPVFGERLQLVAAKTRKPGARARSRGPEARKAAEAWSEVF